MSWTYSGNPDGSDKDKVRFLVGDTVSSDQLITDEEITWALTEGNVYTAVSLVARAISSKYARKADFEVSKDLKVSYSKQAQQYSDLADKFEIRAKGLAPKPYAGGISVSDKEVYEADTDRVTPAFTRDMFEGQGDSGKVSERLTWE